MTPRASAPELHVPETWRALPLSRMAGTTLLLGACDAGKSTLARWLVGELSSRFGRAAWLDADAGQSSLGLPTTMNLLLEDVRAPRGRGGADRSFFVGGTSPRGHMLPVLTGVRRLRDEAFVELEAGALVVDTTGFISPAGGGAALKQWKIELLRPRHVIALQRVDELEPLLVPLRREAWTEVHVLRPVEAAQVRSARHRAERRSRLLEAYFFGAPTRTLNASTLPVYGSEWALPGRLLSLQDDRGFSLGIGVLLENRGEHRYRILSPADLTQARSVRFGAATLPNGAASAWPLGRE